MDMTTGRAMVSSDRWTSAWMARPSTVLKVKVLTVLGLRGNGIGLAKRSAQARDGKSIGYPSARQLLCLFPCMAHLGLVMSVLHLHDVTKVMERALVYQATL